jgi:hypothetical protein
VKYSVHASGTSAAADAARRAIERLCAAKPTASSMPITTKMPSAFQ